MPYTIQDHDKATAALASQVALFHSSGTPFRINHGSTNSTRARAPGTPELDITSLRKILRLTRRETQPPTSSTPPDQPTVIPNHDLSVNKTNPITFNAPLPRAHYAATLLCEPNVPLDELLAYTLPHKLMPPVVPEFPGITVGGAFSGASGESSSFKYGLFDCCVLAIEVILGDGRVVWAEKFADNEDDRNGDDQREDGVDGRRLLESARCALGTLGVVTMLEVGLGECKPFVEVEYVPVRSVREICDVLQQESGNERLDFVDGIMFGKTRGVVMRGRMVDSTQASVLRRTTRPWDEWFYLAAEKHTHHPHQTNPSGTDQRPDNPREVIPLRDYIFRYDRGAFWAGKSFFDYFNIPFNRLTRGAFDVFLHTREIYKAMHASGNAEQNIVQDLMVPLHSAEAFLEYVDDEFGIWPIWLCPVRKVKGDDVVMHPFAPHCEDGVVFNLGVWGAGPEDADEFRRANGRMEGKLDECGGRKVLYSHTFYTEADFEALCNCNEYRVARKRFGAEGLPSVWDKVKPREMLCAVQGSGETGTMMQRILGVWPFGGLYCIFRILWI